MNCNNNEWEEKISLHYSADEIDAALSKVMTLINKVDETLDDSIVQLKDGNEWKYPENANPVYPLTKASAVFFGDDITQTLDKKLKFDTNIFDVSVYNNVEIYESLELALYSIPVSERKSGMIIKFLNGQNNYEVWRYLKTYNNTIVGNINFLDTKNWQGIKLGISSIWQENNPILSLGSIGIETDTNLIKVGDGVTEWNELPYNKVVCKNEKGDSKVDPMSQFAVTKELNLLDQKIFEEQNRAETAEQELQQRIDTKILEEKNRAEAAEQNLQEQLDTKILEEQNRAENVEQNLQDQIDAIISGGADVNIYTKDINDNNISAIFVGEETTIRVVGQSSIEASQIVIKRDNVDIKSESNISLISVDDIVTIEDLGSVKYDAIFTILGSTKSVSKNVNVVYPIYYGAADAYTDLINDNNKASARISPVGIYNIDIPSPNYKYIWFIIPENMTINIAKDAVTGFEFSLLPPESQIIGDVSYKVYRTPNTQEPGLYKVELF